MAAACRCGCIRRSWGRRRCGGASGGWIWGFGRNRPECWPASPIVWPQYTRPSSPKKGGLIQSAEDRCGWWAFQPGCCAGPSAGYFVAYPPRNLHPSSTSRPSCSRQRVNLHTGTLTPPSTSQSKTTLGLLSPPASHIRRLDNSPHGHADVAISNIPPMRDHDAQLVVPMSTSR